MAYDHFAYFSKLAKALPEIGQKKFLKASTPAQLEGLLSNNSSLSGFILIACAKAESKFFESGNEAVFKNNKFEFMVLHPTAQGNSNTIFEAFDNCENLCDRIVSRLFRDAKIGQDIPLQSLIPELIQYDNVGPVADTWYGVLVTFTLRKPHKYTFNKKEWNE
jgi:hypothetical protein